MWDGNRKCDDLGKEYAANAAVFLQPTGTEFSTAGGICHCRPDIIKMNLCECTEYQDSP